MLVDNKYKIQITIPSYKPIKKLGAVLYHKYDRQKWEMSNICYRPFFCGDDKLSVNDYKQKYEPLYSKSDNKIGEQIQHKYTFNQDNSDICKKLTAAHFPNSFIRAVMSNIDENNSSLVSMLLNEENYKAIPLLMIIEAAHKNKSLKAFGIICDFKKSRDEDFPIKYSIVMPEKLQNEEIETLRKVYDSKYLGAGEKSRIFWEINPINIEILDEFMKSSMLKKNINITDVVSDIDITNANLIVDIMRDTELSCKLKNKLITEAAKSDRSREVIEQLYHNKDIPINMLSAVINNEYMSIGAKKFIAECDIKKGEKKVKHQFEMILKNPQKYFNNDSPNEELTREIEKVLNDNSYYSTFMLGCIFDKESLDVLFRKRLFKAFNYLDTINKFEYDELNLLSAAVKLPDKNGKKLSPTQKIELVDIIENHRKCKIPFTNMENMVRSGKIDIAKLRAELTLNILALSDINKEKLLCANPESIDTWNIEYIQQLGKTLGKIHAFDKKDFADVIEYAISDREFKECLHDSNTGQGKINLETKKIYEDYGLDYELWLNPPKKLNIRFSSENNNTDKLKQIVEQLIEDVEFLRSTPAKIYIDKQYKKCIKEDRFIVPREIANNKNNLECFIEKMIVQLDGIWKRAENNINVPEKSTSAKNTLIVLNHLNQRLKDISELETLPNEKPLDITIKTWDRIPQKDLFQGNFSSCCIGMGEGTAHVMPKYLLNTTFNMIELVDNTTGETIGNILCYFAAGKSKEPVLILDNIEIRNNYKPSNVTGKNLRNAIKKYAAKFADSVTGNKNTPIYLGTRYNDISTSDLKENEQYMSIIGKISGEDIYLDAFGGWNRDIGFGNLSDGWFQINSGLNDIVRFYKIR